MGDSVSKTRVALSNWESSFRELRPELQRFLRRRSHVPQSAEDLAQEVYLRLLRFPAADVIEQPQSYLYRVASNVVHDFNLRARASLVTYDSPAAENAAQHADSGVWRDDVADPIADQQEIEQLMAALPAAWRAALILRHRDGLSHEEIAARMRTSIESVRKYLVRGQARLRLFRQQRESTGSHP